MTNGIEQFRQVADKAGLSETEATIIELGLTASIIEQGLPTAAQVMRRAAAVIASLSGSDLKQIVDSAHCKRDAALR